MFISHLFSTALFVGLISVPVCKAGCLEPDINLGQGTFVVESCAYHSTTDAVYDDPRIQSVKGSDVHKNPLIALGVSKTKGKAKILSLSAENQGVILKGKFNNQTDLKIAFFRTKDRNFCQKMVDSNNVKVQMHEMCCDCQNSCVESPCALGTRNEIIKLKRGT